MCIYSSFVDEIDRRNARVGENLTLADYQRHSVLRGDDGKVTCLKHGTTVMTDCLMFTAALGAPTHRLFKKLIGKPITLTLMRPMRGYSADRFTLPDGTVAHLDWLDKGMTFRIPRKVRKDKGVRKRNLTKALGLDQIRADVPVKSTVEA